jgi:hypothetical protein
MSSQSSENDLETSPGRMEMAESNRNH